QHGACGGKVRRHGFLGKDWLAERQRTHGDLRLYTWQRGYGDCLHVLVIDQCTPVAIGFWHRSRPGEFGFAPRVATRQRDHLTAWIGTKRRQLHCAAVVGADYSQADHGLKNPTIRDLSWMAWI